jgi:hypothetical protein
MESLMNFTVKIEPTKRIIWIRNFLEENSFIGKLQGYILGLGKTDKAKIMINELNNWIEHNPHLIVDKVSIVLNMCIDKREKPQHVLPILRWIEFDEVFDSNPSRYQQLVNFILTVLHQEGWLGTNTSTGEFKCKLEPPMEADDKTYSPAPKYWYINEDVTGRYINKKGSHGLDHNFEALASITNVCLRITDSWMDKPEMVPPERSSCTSKEEYENKMKTHNQYRYKLAEPITATYRQGWFYIPYVQDSRYRDYSACECVNHTADKQIRSIIELYNKEKYHGNFSIPDTEVDIDIPLLEEEIPF